ncbi:hypothetical protein H4R21_005293 [Coemansia helicoidea]|uniref:Uncharacterized protein n=1 Tax=Coemansia helicoidea TaxID=1286919 RepID=A0ACC1KTT2_9FUNG|nr:hypothetical protein H4R21_005293 [Coemansia helicoidea]
MARSTASTVSAALAAAALAAVALTAQAAPVADLHRRWGTGGCAGVGYGGWGYGVPGYGGWGYGVPGYGGWGYFPFAASSTNAFSASNSFAHFNDDTLYVNNRDATAASSNVNSFSNVNVVA